MFQPKVSNAMKHQLLIILFITHFISFGQIDLENGLVGSFLLNGNTNDESVFAIDGQVYNVETATGITNLENSAYSFNGIDSYIDYGTNSRNITDVVVVDFWLKTTATEYQHMVSKYDWTVDRGFFVGVFNGHVKLDGRNNSGTYTATQSESAVNDGNWHHVMAAVYDNTWEIWIDCKLEAVSESYSQNPNLVNSEPLTIGNYNMGDVEGDHLEFKGCIDNIRIYNRLLSNDEIGKLCDARLSVPEISDQANQIIVFPVPVNDFITIETNGIQVDHLEIVDPNGALVFSGEMEKEVDVSKLLPGIYFIELYTPDSVFTKKIVVE